MKSIYKRPLIIILLAGIAYTITSLVLNITGISSYSNGIFPFPKTVSLVAQGLALLLFIIKLFIPGKRFLFYTGCEILIVQALYAGNIYPALFLSAILLVFLLTENAFKSKKTRLLTVNILIYILIEAGKLALVIPLGVVTFLQYAGLNLFALCAIGYINLIFKQAYSKNTDTKIDLADYKFSDRQKDCIKEIVVNNTTIKELAINHNISESAIKKDLNHIYNVLGINGKADLKVLFIGYKF